MEQATRIPEDTTLVVRPDPRAVTRAQLPMIIVFGVTTVVAAFGVAVTTLLGIWTVIGLLCLGGMVMELLTLRSEVAFGPALAADGDHVWVRAGGFLRPASVRLDWSDITGVTLHTWYGRRNATARYLMFKVTDTLSPDLRRALDSAVDRRMRRLAKTFGAPLAISAAHKTTSLDEAFRELRELAPKRVRFTHT